MTGRQLKKHIRQCLLTGQDWRFLQKLPARQAVNPLISFLCSTDDTLKWRAITAIGMLVSSLADADVESARVIMRRLMWHLNDESGGIGWGVPEAMGEIMARNARLAREFQHILISYARPDGNFLEHPTLQRGVLWGIGRLAHAGKGEFSHDALALLHPFLQSSDHYHRGLAAWAIAAFETDASVAYLTACLSDQRSLTLYHGECLRAYTVAQIAQMALAHVVDRPNRFHLT